MIGNTSDTFTLGACSAQIDFALFSVATAQLEAFTGSAFSEKKEAQKQQRWER